MNKEGLNEYEGKLPVLNEEQKRFLKSVAREAVERYVRGEPQRKLLTYDPALNTSGWGVFVTLKVKGKLRGCIGCISSNEPLPEAVAELAIKSASSDPRFIPIGPAELDDLDIEISILGPLEEVKDYNEIIIGKHGLVVEGFGRHGLLLPQVALEYGLDVSAFLAQTCIKAGLPKDAWKSGAKVYKFLAEFF